MQFPLFPNFPLFRDFLYQFLTVHKAGIEKLRAGVKLADVYKTVKDHLAASKFPKLADKLGKSIGFAMGIDFRESALLIATKNTQSAKKGIFYLCLIKRFETCFV